MVWVNDYVPYKTMAIINYPVIWYGWMITFRIKRWLLLIIQLYGMGEWLRSVYNDGYYQLSMS